MLLYALLGVAQAIFTFSLGSALGSQAYFASKNLHHQSMFKVFHAPMSFFDTTVRNTSATYAIFLTF